jgi:hypothetical protein
LEDRADVYAFGLLLWELMHERRAFEGMEGIAAFLGACDGLRPQFSEACHRDLMIPALTAECWAQRPEDRPSMSTVLERLEACMQAHCVRSGIAPQSVISEDHAHGHAEASSSRPTHVEASSSRPTAEASSSRPTAAPSKIDQIGEHVQRNLRFWRSLSTHQP